MATLKNKVSSYTASEPTTSTPSVLSEKGNVNSTILVDAPTKFSTFNKFNNNNFNNYNNNDNNSSRNAMEIHCDIPGCGKVFPTTFAFESHYSAVHRHSCRYCKKVFPTSKLLSIHLLETHDTLFMVMSERKPMYECLVEGCSQLFWDALLRKEHLVSKYELFCVV